MNIDPHDFKRFNLQSAESEELSAAARAGVIQSLFTEVARIANLLELDGLDSESVCVKIREGLAQKEHIEIVKALALK